ncbi:hypothetical protein [Sphingomonas sp. Leaf4]|uniref:hypothetical protein n=1 Tax=Sphingomonas sp. Leaf4 TaxID=2876553 RepID=UPI001E307E46|nr:hypothetical protein [Sphingomonas sp. Leaf4]
MVSPLLTVLLAGALQAAPPQQPAEGEIVVTAAQRDAMRETARRVEAVLPPTTIDQPLARFTDPICPGVVGLSRETGQAIVDRIGIVADGIGLRIGAPGCDPNVLLIVTADGRAMVRGLMTRRTANLRAQTLADMRRILGEPGGARGWVEWETRSRDGERATVSGDGPPTLEVQGASRLANAFRRDIVSAVVVIDTAAATTRSPLQIADYVAMRALADARPGRRIEAESILAAFAPGDGQATPDTLTPFDRGILRGLYSGQGNVTAGMKRATMVRAILDPGGGEAPGG